MRPNITVREVEYHRNGIGGEPFYVARFRDDDEETEMIAILFAPDVQLPDGVTDWSFAQGFHNPRVAVLALDILPEIGFGRNSWRGDNYAEALYAAIRERQEAIV
jgi:hypothetical protein